MTTKTDTEQLRAEFEAWRRKHYDYDDLNAFEIEFAFEAYQAGRAAVLADRQQRGGDVIDDMRAAVRFAPSSAYWSERLREFFGPDAREGIDALEKQLREASAALAAQPAAATTAPSDENGGHCLMEPDHETALALADAPRSLRNYVAALQAENERLLEERDALAAKVASYERAERDINEALNMGNGSYLP